MRTSSVAMLALSTCLSFLYITCKQDDPHKDPCYIDKAIEPEHPPCCTSAATSQGSKPSHGVATTKTILRLNSIINCPCDSTLIEIDSLSESWDPDEETIVQQSKREPEGDPIFILPVPDVYDHERYGRNFIDAQGRTFDDKLERAPIKIAILDSGLDTALLREHAYEIAEVKNMFTFDENVADGIGHGTAVFSVIDGHAKNRAQYYIYKCINDDGYATTFSIACALKCAEAAGADIINLSLGSYEYSEILDSIIETRLPHAAIITSEGNNCTVEEVRAHYPSHFKHTFGVISIDANWRDRSAPGAMLWGCTNGSRDFPNIAAPSILTSSDGDSSTGTSFAAAYVTGRFATYLFGHERTNPHRLFRDQFLRDTSMVAMDQHYLHAARKCVDITVVR